MNIKIGRNLKKYYNRNEIRYRPVFCLYRKLGDYLFIWETAYIKEKFIPVYGGSFEDAWEKLLNGHDFDTIYLKGHWIYISAMPKEEAFLDAL